MRLYLHFLHPAHSPDPASSNCHLFRPVNEALRGRHFAVYKELKKVFVTSSQVEARNFTALVYRVFLDVGESVLKITKTLWKNSIKM
jgi:hypothetical protein